MSDKTIYRLNDEISFRKCSLFVGDELTFGDCTNFGTTERSLRTKNLNQPQIVDFLLTDRTKHFQIVYLVTLQLH